MKGLFPGRMLDKVGQDEPDTAELFSGDVQVPPDNVIGELNTGFIHGEDGDIARSPPRWRGRSPRQYEEVLLLDAARDCPGGLQAIVPVKDVAAVAWWMPSDELAVCSARRTCTCAWCLPGVRWIDIGQSQVLEPP